MPIWSSVLNFLCPPICTGCNHLGEPPLCANCLSAIPHHQTFFCATCSARLPDARKTCHPDTPYILGAATDFSAEPIHNAIHALKFQGIRSAAEPLGNILADYALGLPLTLREFVLLPIPLSPERARERGYNQAELIAQVLAKRTGCTLTKDWLTRPLNREAQSLAKSRAARATNIAGCFLVPKPETVSGAKIILVDDVATSGATLAEAARTLRHAGAGKVIALVVARA